MFAFLQRVIVIPETLSKWLLAVFMAGFIWLEMFLGSLIGIDLTGRLEWLAVGLAAFLTFLVKTLLEKIPEQFHPIVNAILSWLAILVGGVLLYRAALFAAFVF